MADSVVYAVTKPFKYKVGDIVYWRDIDEPMEILKLIEDGRFTNRYVVHHLEKNYDMDVEEHNIRKKEEFIDYLHNLINETRIQAERVIESIEAKIENVKAMP